MSTLSLLMALGIIWNEEIVEIRGQNFYGDLSTIQGNFI